MEVLVLSFAVFIGLFARDYAIERNWSLGAVSAEFLTSPGFAGCFAVLAAFIGFTAVHKQLQHSRLELAHEQYVESNKTWWATFQWVADKTLVAKEEGGTLPPTIAAAMLLDLSKDELRTAPGSPELRALWESRLRACNGLALELSSQVTPSTPLGQEVLDSLTKLAGLTEDAVVGHPAPLNKMLDRLTTQRGMYQKLGMVCKERGIELLTAEDEIAERLGLDGFDKRPSGRPSRSNRFRAEALALKGDKAVWVGLEVLNGTHGRFQVRQAIGNRAPVATGFAAHPYMVVLSQPLPDNMRARLEIPDYVHVVADVGSEMKDKLAELLE